MLEEASPTERQADRLKNKIKITEIPQDILTTTHSTVLDTIGLKFIAVAPDNYLLMF